MNSTDNTQSKNKENSNEVSDDGRFIHHIKNIKGDNLYTKKAGDDRIKKYKDRFQENKNLQHDTTLNKEFAEQIIRDSAD